jgi:peptidoglycan/LPS O-acetylase OafA/YrhL
LDAVRGVAILQVMFAHAFPGHGGIGGYVGVDLFFVLSGFLIGGNLIDRLQEPSYFSCFYIRRGFRILPLYYLLIIACAPLTLLQQPLWRYLTFVQNFHWAHLGTLGDGWDGVTWSLAVEEQFYLLAPLLICLVPLRRLPASLCALILLAPCFRVIAVETTTLAGTVVLMPSRLDSLCAGVLAAWILRFGRVDQRVLSAALVTCSLVYFAVFAYSGGRRDSVIMWTVGYTIEGTFFALSIVAMMVTDWRGNRVLQWFGTRAYGLYLLHALLLRLTGNAFLGLALAAVLAELSWRYLEAPLIAYSKRITGGSDRLIVLAQDQVISANRRND